MPGANYTNKRCLLSGRRACCPNPPPLSVNQRLQNPSKTRTKSDRFCECEFFTPVTSTACNFNTLKCTDFPDGLLLDLWSLVLLWCLGFGIWGFHRSIS